MSGQKINLNGLNLTIFNSRPRSLSITSNSSCETQKPKRKRQRLDHLTQEEKLQRRKLKNRVAAQSARDRKKQKMSELEESLDILVKEKVLLMKSNRELLAQNERLVKENEELRKRLQLSKLSPLAIEPAEFISVCQPNSQVRWSTQLWSSSQTHFHRFSQILYLTILTILPSLTFSQSVLPTFSVKKLMTKTWDWAYLVDKTFALLMKKHSHFSHQWWGPQQRSWNPSKILRSSMF